MLKDAYEKNSHPTQNQDYNGAPADTNNATDQQAVVSAEAPRFVPPTHGGVDILKLLSELEDMIENATHLPFGTIARFDEDKFHMTILKIRANLPQEMIRASKLARETERILEEAREHSTRLVEETREGARKDMARGKSEAGRLREEALVEAKSLREATQAEIKALKETAQAEANEWRAAALDEAKAIQAEANAAGKSLQDAALREAAEIQEEARSASDQILNEAQAQAAQMVSDSTVVRRAEQEARQIVDRAAQEAMTVRRGADDYARDVLANLEAVLGKAYNQVQQGRAYMEQNR